uniref:NADH dehydrogenase subunit 4L n=1 Tax=Ergasilus tumidus TaxID=342420 RepID=UPI002435B12B|nr:NADH dehydrogenase subunit 4L [Ergasilus tumidus]WEU66989.1 NADH dehydrogenase subunit 4L [Ergasilus tumidus]
MISLGLMVVVLMSALSSAMVKSLLIIVWLSLMILAYAKWRSHFSVILINLEFFTLVLLYLMFSAFSSMNLTMPLVMALTTSLVMEACVGLSLLILIVRTHKSESLISSLS